VPLLVVSPFSKTAFVDHNQYETVSLLAFIEGLYGLPPLNAHDANALPPVAAFSGQPDLFIEAKAGSPVSYQIPAYNSPTSYLGGLGQGLTLNPQTGLVTGTPPTSGSQQYIVVVPGQNQLNTLRYLVQVDVN
jgi:hypothetical protein